MKMRVSEFLLALNLNHYTFTHAVMGRELVISIIGSIMCIIYGIF